MSNKSMYCLIAKDAVKNEQIKEGAKFNSPRGGLQVNLNDLLMMIPETSVETVKKKFDILELNVEDEHLIFNEKSMAIRKGSNSKVISISGLN